MKPSTLASLVAVALFGVAAQAPAQTTETKTTVEKKTNPVTGAQTTTTTTTRTEFVKLDTNADGVLVIEEVPTADTFAKVFTQYDIDRDRKVTRIEYDTYLTGKPMAASTTTSTTTTIKRPAFVVLDSNADGYIVINEIPTDNAFKKVWVQYDKDGDKRITKVEYEPYYTVSVDVDD